MTTFTHSEAPSNTAFPIARAGYPFIGALAFSTAVFALLGLTVAALTALVCTFFVCFFFRDPDRVIPKLSGAVVSPADGRIVWAAKVDESPFSREPCLKISIFMSVFNVHVNRSPHEGTIQQISYHPGKFISANLNKASRHNERNAILLETDSGIKLCVVQIAGLIARRIICWLQEGERIDRGQRLGLICFGSRLDVYLPAETRLKIKLGDRVCAGTSILAELTG